MSIFTDNIFTQDPLASVIEEKTIQLKEGERRTVSILFADLKGFTEMSEKLDSELVQTTIDKIMRVFTQSIENYGGYIDKYSGDGIMALFGAKVASEVDTERAIRAGLQMLNNLKGYNHYLKKDKKYGSSIKPLAIRIGINTGLVTTGKIGKGRGGDFTVYGDAVNLASRLESNAPINGILVPETIQQMLPDQFKYEDRGKIKVKGKSVPVSVFTVKQIKKVSSEFQTKYTTPFIGRDADLKFLLSAYKSATRHIGSESCITSMIGIKAEAGLGKTRLINEFIKDALPRGINPNYVIIGRATNLTRQPYYIFITLLRSVFQISEIDGLGAGKTRLNKTYKELKICLNSSEQKQLAKAKAVIEFLLGISTKDVRLQTTGKELQTHIHIALFHFLQLITLRCNQTGLPLLIILEDLHWIDDPSLNALQFLIQEFSGLDNKKGLTNFFLFDYRDTFAFPKEMNLEKNFHQLTLPPLSDDHTREMISLAFHLDILPEYELKNIMKISGGNPFYIEEWIAYINSKQQETGLSVAEVIKKHPVPTSLNALILSRVDLLDENSKRVLQSAAVMGVQFYASILQSLHGELKTGINITDALKEFIDKGLIHKGSLDQYRFKHILAREVVYEAILKSNRKMFHREIGSLLEVKFIANLNMFYYDLAEHFEKAREYEKAVVYLEKAGHKAQDLFDNGLAAEFYQNLVNIMEQPEYSGNILELKKRKWKAQNKQEKKKLASYLTFQFTLGDLYAITSKWNAAESIYNDILPAVKSTGNPLYFVDYCSKFGYVFHLKSKFKDSRNWLSKGLKVCRENEKHRDYAKSETTILSLLGSLNIDEGHLDEAEKVFIELQKLITNTNEPMDLVRLNGNLGVLYLRQGKMKEAYAHFEKQFEMCKKYGYKNQSSQALGNMGVINNILGKFKAASKIFNRIIEIAEEIGDRRVLGQTYGNLGIAHLQLHEYDTAIKHMHTLLSISTHLNDTHSMIDVNNNIGYTYLQMGLYDTAIKHCKISLTLNKEVGIPESEAQSCDNMGNAYFEMGNFNTAGKYMKKSLAIFTELGNKRGKAITEGGLGEILIEENKLSDAVQLFTSALDVFNEINDQPKLARFYIKRAMARQKLNDYDLAADDLAKAGEVAAILNDKTYIFMTKLYSALNHIKKDVMTIHSSEKTLKNLDDPKLEQENKALLYFHLWQISGSKIYADKSLKLYQPLYQSKLSYSIKQKIDLLRS